MDLVRFAILFTFVVLGTLLVAFRPMDWGLRLMVGFQVAAWSVAFGAISSPRPLSLVGWAAAILLILAYAIPCYPLVRPNRRGAKERLATTPLPDTKS